MDDNTMSRISIDSDVEIIIEEDDFPEPFSLEETIYDSDLDPATALHRSSTIQKKTVSGGTGRLVDPLEKEIQLEVEENVSVAQLWEMLNDSARLLKPENLK